MIVIQPIEIGFSDVQTSNILPDDAPFWDPDTTYSKGDRVILLGLNQLFESLTDNNLNNTPQEGGTADWLDTGLINKFRMFDRVASTVSLRTGNIDATVRAPLAASGSGRTFINACALINVRGTSFTVEVSDIDTGELVFQRTESLIDPTSINSWYEYFYGARLQRGDVAILDFPAVRGADVRVTVNAGAGAAAQIGEFLLGAQIDLGDTQWGANIGIKDFSVKDEDQFGNDIIVKRGFRRRLNIPVSAPVGQAGRIDRVLSFARSTPTLFIGSQHRDDLTVFGFYRDYSVVLANPAFAELDIEIESLTISEKDPFFGGANIQTPSITVPASQEEFPINGIIRSTPFTVIPEGADTHQESDWQIATDSMFNSIVEESLNDPVNLTSYTIVGALANGDYWLRMRQIGTLVGASPWSLKTKFTLVDSATVSTPTITSPIDSQPKPFDAPITTSAFVTTPADQDDHLQTHWQLSAGSDFVFPIPIVDAFLDDLTSWTPDPALLTPGQTYYVRCAHVGRKLGETAFSPTISFVHEAPAGQVVFESSADWIVPAGVFATSAVAVGRGGQEGTLGGAGGSLRYLTTLAVTPGETLAIEVPTTETPTRILRGSTVLLRADNGGRGFPGGGTEIGGDVGGADGAPGGSTGGFGTGVKFGGGAAGYSADGNTGQGGSGASGNAASSPSLVGGGVGLAGEGASGTPDTGQGGSGGEDAGLQPGKYGGGGGRNFAGTTIPPAPGAVRIIWGANRAYPSTNTEDA